jgi:hypothetical protein
VTRRSHPPNVAPGRPRRSVASWLHGRAAVPRSHPRTPTSLLAALAAGVLLVPAIAVAQAPMDPGMSSVPGAEAFNILYYITDEDGKRLRPMATNDFTRFVNQARCECGHQIETQVRLKATPGVTYDNTKLIETFVGTMCGTAETNPVGQFRRCAKLKSSTAPEYVQGLNTTFHPVWLTGGVSLESGEVRDPKNAIAAGKCTGGQGESGVWMCAQTNSTQGCQSDEFFISGTQNNNLPAGMSSGIKFDFLPPVTQPDNVEALAGDSAIVIKWDVQPGDINGFRVLCEEAATGKPPPDKGLARPALDLIPNGTIYYTKQNLCGNKPFSTFKGGSDTPIDPGVTTDPSGSTTDDSAGTTDDTASSGTDTGSDTSTTGGTDDTGSSDSTGVDTDVPVPVNCGDGVIQADENEQCDDGADNGDDKACHLNCQTDICGDGKRGPEEGCDKGKDNGDANICRSDCTPNTSQGLLDLDWAYVCTGHLAYNTKSVRIEGLENDKEYNFLLVSYDSAGNPVAYKEVITATPVDTQDLWEQCHEKGDICGESGFCNVGSRSDGLLALGALLGLGLGVGGLVRRSRRKRA